MPIGRSIQEVPAFPGLFGRWLVPLRALCALIGRVARGAARGAAGSDGQVFGCPVCHQQCPLGDIMENFFLQDSGAGPALGQGSRQSCTSCEDNAAATSFCLECAEPLCETCVEAHQRVRYTRDHTVRALGGAVPRAGAAQCPVHPAEPLELFCSTCDTLTCRDCHLGTHRDHQCPSGALPCPLAVPTLCHPPGSVPCVPPRSPRAAVPPLSQIHSQLLRALRVIVEPVEPQGDMKFQWDLHAWTKSAESFGEGTPGSRAWGDKGQEGAGRGVTKDGREEDGGDKGQEVPGGSLGLPGAPLVALTTPSPPRLSRRKPGNSPREEKFVKKLLIKRRGPPGAQGSPLLPKVPRVSLERLELDLELDPAQPPVFRIFPGPSAEEFSVIVIEQGTPGTAGTAQPHGALRVKVPLSHSHPRECSMSPSLSRRSSSNRPSGTPGTLGTPNPWGCSPLPRGSWALPQDPPRARGSRWSRRSQGCVIPGMLGVSCCRVCGQAGAVVMCDRCQRCFHLHCHLPALQDVPSPEWTCLLCQELPPPSLDMEQGPPHKMSPLDQQKCEYVLLELLCHEPCRPLQRLSSSPDSRDAIDLTLMRARLQEKLSPHYRSPEEFARDGWRLLRQFHQLTEDKADVQSILGLQRFLESRLSTVFGDQKFSRLLVDPEESLELSPGC
ncbi:PREDICTED: LOW QUALITY PROTEIN: transcription intermediary factor 1-beta [Corvus brachyrhynchos]|uniref:LOW QUALITY PROTEIN: transcription intermediary factor 1-beta n=1 Tax=Corvus brachyrhynchos TaxID=85066 RepID=UPI000816546F|nr:PREDICTED: LOW QUALITY PROTEIN: transcription intermediary factor 1-beta [Corvus brachyrhynchos]